MSPVSPVGREIERVDGPLKVRGEARYAADYDRKDKLYAYVVTSTVGRGEIRAMDTRAAQRSPGVVAVYSPFRKLGLYADELGFGENFAPLESTEIRYRGQAIALVVAETFEQARDAAALVTTTYDARTPRLSLEENSPGQPAAGGPGAGAPPPSSTILAPGVESFDQALAASDVVVESSFHQPVQHHIAMEPHATLAVWNDGQLTVYAGSQFPPAQAQIVAMRLGISPEAMRVRIIASYTGGGFGSRVASWSETVLAAGAARLLERPVKLVLTREQVFTMIGHRGQVNQTIRLGASRDGVLTAVSHVSDAELPAVGGWHLVPANDVTAVLYQTPNLHIEQREVVLDTPPTWAMRGPNEAPGAYALETTMDELAVRLGIDPVELRLRNYATAVPGTGQVWSSKHLDECYRVGARRFGWSARRNEPGSRVEGEWQIGLGMATAIYPLHRAPVSARIRLRDDDTAVVSTATADMGTGAYTVLSVVGADALGISLQRIVPRLGDSSLPPGAPAAGSMSTASTAPAVQAAARDVIAALIDLAVTNRRSPWFGADPEELSYREGRLRSAGGRSMTFGRLLRTTGSAGVSATASVAAEEGIEERYRFDSFGAHFCEVRVNRFTREIRVARFTTVVDVGRVVNAKAARSQLVGGVIFGIGHALLEDDPVEPSGRLAAGNLADYMVPVNADVPELDVHWLDKPDPVVSEFGARGMGELGAVGSSAAIANAVFNATGVRVRTTPITLDKLL